MTEKQQELYEKLLKKVNEYCLGYAAEDVIAAIDALVENYERRNHLPTPKTKAKIDSLLIEPLQALKQFRNSQYQGVNVYADELLDIIETAVKAFTLLDDCDIDVWLIKHCDYENYCRVRTLCLKATGNADIDDANREVINLPTEKEYELLKEILK